jgi:MFS family permease
VEPRGASMGVGRRRIMLVGLVLLRAASLATAFVTTAGQLIAVRAATGSRRR